MLALFWLLVVQMQFEDFAHFNVRQRDAPRGTSTYWDHFYLSILPRTALQPCLQLSLRPLQTPFQLAMFPIASD